MVAGARSEMVPMGARSVVYIVKAKFAKQCDTINRKNSGRLQMGGSAHSKRLLRGMMADENSVTFWIQAVRAGDSTAAQELWNRYFDKLMRLARARMNHLPKATYDEEDAAISTFQVLYRQLQNGSYPELSDRDELWQLMLTVMARKINRRAEYESAAKRSSNGLPATPFDSAAVIDTTAVEVADECGALLTKLADPNLEQVALWKLDGFTNDEIAQKLNKTRRTVQRMLNLIREIWTNELLDDQRE